MSVTGFSTAACSGFQSVIGKGNKERLLYRKPMTARLLADCLSQNNAPEHLFPGAENSHVTIATLEREFQSYVKAAGFPKRVTPHALQHLVAVHYLMGGAPISFVQQLLGHES